MAQEIQRSNAALVQTMQAQNEARDNMYTFLAAEGVHPGTADYDAFANTSQLFKPENLLTEVGIQAILRAAGVGAAAPATTILPQGGGAILTGAIPGGGVPLVTGELKGDAKAQAKAQELLASMK